MYNKKPIIAVTNRSLCVRPFLEQIDRVASQKPEAIILREKDLTQAEYEALAKEVLPACRRHEVTLILHQYPAVAKRLGMDIIQLSFPLLKEYMSLPKSKAALKCGCSVHSVEEGKEAERLGASYLIAGHIYETDCKRGVPPRGVGFLEELCKSVTIPVYAIGGIGMENGRIEEVLQHGARGACIMSEMMRI